MQVLPKDWFGLVLMFLFAGLGFVCLWPPLSPSPLLHFVFLGYFGACCVPWGAARSSCKAGS